MEKVFSKPVDDSDWWKVVVNGRGIDLAYIYFRKDGVWRNMALYLKMEYITDVPETIPEVFVDKWKYINPETIIQDCRDASREHFSHGTTVDMEAGRRGVVICLENAIITHASILLDEKDFPPEVIRSELKKLREAYGGLYRGMYNDNKSCGISCGSFNYSLHLSVTAKLYESILRDVIAFRKRYNV